MNAQSLAAIALVALLASGAAAQDQPSPDEQLLELKRELIQLWAEMASDPTSLRPTPEWRAMRSQYVELRKGLRDLERRHRAEQTEPRPAGRRRSSGAAGTRSVIPALKPASHPTTVLFFCPVLAAS